MSRREIPGKYVWLPSVSRAAYGRLQQRYGDRLSEFRQRYLFVDLALMLGMAAWAPKGMRRTRQDILDGLSLISEMKVLLEFNEEDFLVEARRRGITYREIASAMGLGTRQAAEQRHLRLAGGKSEKEAEHLNRRRLERFGNGRNVRGHRENHNMNWVLAQRWAEFNEDSSRLEGPE